jgi:transcriptional regulator with XRE-family HTH domain
MARKSRGDAGRVSLTKAKPNADDRQIGGHLKVLRAARGMTLESLAAATGLTKSYLSKIQNSRQAAADRDALAHRERARHRIGSFFGDILEAREGRSVVRRSERLPVVRGGTAFGYDYVSLAHQRLSKSMEPFVFTFPSKIDTHVFFDHGGEEFVFILSGTVVFQVGDQRWTLEEGDTIYFDAAIPHGDGAWAGREGAGGVHAPEQAAKEKPARKAVPKKKPASRAKPRARR